MPYPILRPDPRVRDHYRPSAPPTLVATAREFAAVASWTFAHTMPQHPHHYVTKQREAAAGRAAGYDALRDLILDHHYLRDWHGRSFRGVTLGGLTLWIMQTGLIVINAKPAEADDFEPIEPGLFDHL
jgi:hypothetical protein